MIRYALRCGKGHGFDSWFRSGADYEAQEASGLIECPDCGARDVQRSVMAPAVCGGHARPDETSAQPLASLLDDRHSDLRAKLRALRREIAARTENVGTRFAETARAMHEGQIPQKGIRGVASHEQASALLEDGIVVLPVPAMPDDRN